MLDVDADFSTKQTILDAILAALIAWLFFLPITGVLLDGYAVQSAWHQPFVLALIVFYARCLIAIIVHTDLGKRLFVGKGHYAGVEVVDKTNAHWHWLLVIVAIGFVFPFFSSKYWLTVAILALIYVLLGLGLNVVVGLAGLLDLGFVAFYAVGAYSYALGSEYLGLGFWTALPFAAVLAASFGAILGFPVLRMHGDYLAIVTLGFGEIIRLILNNWTAFTGGPNGASAPLPTLFGLEFSRRAKQGGTPFHDYFGLDYSTIYRYILIYLVLFLVVCVMTMVVVRLRQMPIGRAWEALREDETACRSLGINHVVVKLSAFSMGAMVGGLAGVFFAAYQGFINPSSFTFFESALILAIVVLGGLGSVVGVIIAAVVLTILPELLREFSDYRVLIFGMSMVLMMIWRPRGLLPQRRQAFRRT